MPSIETLEKIKEHPGKNLFTYINDEVDNEFRLDTLQKIHAYPFLFIDYLTGYADHLSEMAGLERDEAFKLAQFNTEQELHYGHQEANRKRA